MRVGEAGAVVSTVLLLSCRGSQGLSTLPDAAPVAARRPNIILIVTDDLDARSASRLPRLGALLADEGVTFRRTYVAQSLCAPSRATLLTGQYPHNHGVLENSGPDGGFPAFRRLGLEASTLATWLKSAGYHTGLLGKYLNGYPELDRPDYVPPGWDEWSAEMSSYPGDRYVNYSLNENGSVNAYGHSDAEYETDVLDRKALAFIHRAVDEASPFFLYVAPEAPHLPAIPATRHATAFRGEEAPRVPSFNESDVQDKPAFVQNTDLLTPRDVRRLDEAYVSRLRTMLAVEELVGDILAALASAGRLDDTYLFFTSDNGIMLGEHRLVTSKGYGYEESILVPLLVRGPGVPRGVTNDAWVSTVDLAPTVAALAGVDPPVTVDGRSLVPFLRGQSVSGWRTDVLVENWSDVGVSATLRNAQWAYTELESNERELYDMAADPYQLGSQHRGANPVLLDELSKRLDAFLACRAATCRN